MTNFEGYSFYRLKSEGVIEQFKQMIHFLQTDGKGIINISKLQKMAGFKANELAKLLCNRNSIYWDMNDYNKLHGALTKLQEQILKATIKQPEFKPVKKAAVKKKPAAKK